MIRTLLIEDEINARGSLRKMLKIIEPTIEIVGETGYIKEAIKLIETLQPDLIFLDIRLDDGIGFDILELNSISSKIIFITAYNQYAVKAFKFSAIDYLLKPINPEELQQALERAIKAIERDISHKNLLKILKHNIEEKDKKIVLKTSNNQYIVSIKDIVRLEADAAYTLFITTEGKIMTSKNLKYYEDILDENFIRCHQSHLISKYHIHSVQKGRSIVMTNTDSVPISTRKRTQVLELIKNS